MPSLSTCRRNHIGNSNACERDSLVAGAFEASMNNQPNLLGVYLFVRDLPAALAFYRRLELQIEEVSNMYARATMPNGATIEFGTADLTRSYDPTWHQPTGPATNTINFELASRAAVDSTYAALIRAGYVGHLAARSAVAGAVRVGG